jgi:hypothetical protein
MSDTSSDPYLKIPEWVIKKIPEMGAVAFAFYVHLMYRRGKKSSSETVKLDLGFGSGEIDIAFKRLEQAGLLKKVGCRDGKITYELAESEDEIFSAPSLPYHEYLLTPHWQSVRKAALMKAEYKCQVCSKNGARLDVHHNSYENLGKEKESDVIVLCENCHSFFHDKVKHSE